MKPFRFHLLSLVHLPQSKEYLSCAFSQKNRKLAKMLTSLGHEVFFYGSSHSDVEEYCNSDKLHFVQTHTVEDIARDYGDGDNRYEIGYNFHETDFRHDFDKDRMPSTLQFYAVAIEHINRIKKDDDFLLNSMGYYFKPVSDSVKLFLDCEAGIGYRGSFSAPNHFRAFESAFERDFTYGSEHPGEDINGDWYDRIIPNYFAPEDFEYSDKKDDYYLYIGRMISRKGIEIAVKTCDVLGKKLIIAGQGAHVDERGHLISEDFDIAPATWEYFGFANVEDRKKLMSKAIALFVPTLYQEIFGGTHVEAMLSGTPPITTSFGVFNGTLPDCVDGKIGFRCNTLNDFCKAAIDAKNVNHLDIRKYGEMFLMDEVKLKFQQWFEDLYHLYESAAFPGKPGWGWLPEDLTKK